MGPLRPPSMTRWWLRNGQNSSCAWPGCRSTVRWVPGKGRPKFFCHPYHQTAYAREQTRLRTELDAAVRSADAALSAKDRRDAELAVTVLRWQLGRLPDLGS